MKKIPIVSILICLIFVLAGCGSTKKNIESKPTDAVTETVKADDNVTDTENNTASTDQNANQTDDTTKERIETTTDNTTEERIETTTDETTEAASDQTNVTSSKVLVVYFSATGNTKPIAEYIAELTNADLFEIEPEEPYSSEDLNYNEDTCRANQEQNDESARPKIASSIENIADYDVILIGHPIWWGKEPRILDTFMESYDLSGKKLVNFCTSGGSGITTSTSNLKEMSEGAEWMEGHRFETGASKESVREWLDTLNLGIQ